MTETKYKYSPSYIIKERSKYQELINKFHKVFIKHTKNKILTKEEHELFWEGIVECSKYIYYSFGFMINNNYDSKASREKVITAMYWRLCACFDGEAEFLRRFKPSLKDLAESAMFLSLNLTQHKNCKSFVWDQDTSTYSTIVRHAVEVVFKSLVQDFLSTQIKALETTTCATADEIAEDELTAMDILQKAQLDKAFPQPILNEIINYLDYGEVKDLSKLKPYLEIIYEKINN